MSNVHLLCGKESGRLSIQQEEKNLEELKLLMIKPDTDLNVVDDNGRTILHYACGFGYHKIVDLLLSPVVTDVLDKKPINVNAVDKFGQMPMHRASQYGHARIVESLIQHGADITTPDLAGDTPLHLSIGTGKLSVSKLLLDKGAPLFVVNNQQLFPYDKAVLLHKTQPRVMPPSLLQEIEKLLRTFTNEELTNNNKRIFDPSTSASPPPKRTNTGISKIEEEEPPIPSSQTVNYDDIQYKIYKCKDGHHVRSNFERNICDWLWEQDFLHAYELEITVPGPDNAKITLRPDFYLKKENVYVEFWGLTGDVNYEEKRQLKLNTYKHNGMKVIEIFESQMKNYNKVLTNLLIKKIP